ncbi:hypothetical protein [Pontibacter liquoris]|uniref:hypothetical protein n=1 Tax=Pontibacter liquoris TaxID=2905677 RepID=UPI001FA80B65|nr:hypothetical protein [Pontibacter liquoris]
MRKTAALAGLSMENTYAARCNPQPDRNHALSGHGQLHQNHLNCMRVSIGAPASTALTE